MANQTFTSPDKSGVSSNPGSSSGVSSNTGSASHGFEKAASTAKNVADQTKSVADQALSAGRDLKEKAAEMAGSSAETLKGRASDLMDAAKDVASQTTDKLKQTVDGQKNAGADYVGNLADAMRRAAREFDHDLPVAGAYIRKAASQVEGVSDSIKTGNFNDVVKSAQAFARRQPTTFLALAVFAGFGAVRFLKSSAAPSASSARSGSDGFTPTQAGRSYSSNQAGRSYSDNRGYRDEFNK